MTYLNKDRILSRDIGYAIIWKGNRFLERLITRKFGVSHISLVVNENLIIEAMPKGLELWHINRRIEEFDIYGLGRPSSGTIHLFSFDITEKEQETVRSFAYTQYCSEIKYDYPSLWKGLFAKHILMNPTRYLCWEFVADAWMEAKIIPRTDILPDIMDTLDMLRNSRRGSYHLLGYRY